MNTNEILFIAAFCILFAIFLLYIGLKGAHQEPPAVIQKPKVEEEPAQQPKPKRKYYKKSSPRKPK
jgi:hypothetical protein